MSANLYRSIADLKGFSLKNCPPMIEPTGVLMCPPDHFQVLAVKNPYMSSHVGAVDREKARKQWDDVVAAFEKVGCPVKIIGATPGLEDMVFAANSSLAGTRPDGEKVALISSMRHASRRRETDAFAEWYAAEGYRVVRLKPGGYETFEGSGDAVWHPGKRLIWGGHGFRTDPAMFEQVAETFKTPVIQLKLVNERFYHLDTCFCPLTPEAVLIYPSAFDAASLELILKIFPIVVTSSEADAVSRMACNAAVWRSKTAIIQKGANAASGHMRAMGLEVVEVDTSEFVKSGGSVYCMKQYLFG
ncbi:MAG: arginine deiminase-related protein [Elusimicrobiota bacterium]|nr:arginine deiminase-related protein [Elusimicrobiota bacterium]